MPEIVIYLAEGRDAGEETALMKDITDAVVKNFGVNPEAVVVQIVESNEGRQDEGRPALHRAAARAEAAKT